MIIINLKMDILPDNITLKILRYLGWKERIRKEIICKKWKYLSEILYEISISDLRLIIDGCRRHLIENEDTGYFDEKYYLSAKIYYMREEISDHYSEINKIIPVLSKIPFGTVVVNSFYREPVMPLKPLICLLNKKCTGYEGIMNPIDPKILHHLVGIKNLRLIDYFHYGINNFTSFPPNLTTLTLATCIECSQIIRLVIICKNTLRNLELGGCYIFHECMDMEEHCKNLNTIMRSKVNFHYTTYNSGYESCFNLIFEIVRYCYSNSTEIFTLMLKHVPSYIHFEKIQNPNGRKSKDFCRCVSKIIDNIRLISWRGKCKRHIVFCCRHHRFL